MTTAEQLQNKLTAILHGEPWYGPGVFDILARTTFEAAYEKPPGSVHNIAEIVLHMLNWTTEVTERMQGKQAGEPTGGDWPDPGAPDEHKWKGMVNDLKLANVNLSGGIQNFPEDRWDQPTNDYRYSADGKGDSFRDLIEGIIQHHIYHSGQIALLNRIVGGLK